ncbi:MAG: C69 family dipeptidase [Acidimicrobiia bacterium]|nr:C69 family dipeptidase [Acidimicrobiia bacterium]
MAPSRAAGGVALFGKNSDRPPQEPQVLEHHPARTESSTTTTYLTIPAREGSTHAVTGSRPAWMWGFEHGVNDAGVAAGNATIYTTLDPRLFPAALTGMDLVRLVLERAATAAAGVIVLTDLLEAHGQGGSGHAGEERAYWSSVLLADATEAWVVETSGRTWAAESAGATRALSNRTTIPAFDAEHRHPRQPVEALVDPRLDATRAFLAGAGSVGAADVQDHLASHVGGADGWTVCMHVEGVEATTASLVAELHPGGRSVLWAAAGPPCTNPYETVAAG